MQGHLAVVEELIKAGQCFFTLIGNTPNSNLCAIVGADLELGYLKTGSTPLFMASQNNHPEVVRALLKAGANVNFVRRDIGASSLLVAAENGHLEVVKILLEHNADPHICRTTDGIDQFLLISKTALILTAHRNNCPHMGLFERTLRSCQIANTSWSECKHSTN